MDNVPVSDMVVMVCVFALVGWVLYLFFRRYQTSMQVRLQTIESFNRLIEKFGTSKEFVDFVQTDEGKKLINAPAFPPANPLSKVLRFLQAGVLFVIIGVGYWVNGLRLRTQTDPNYVHQMLDSQYWGTLALFVGVGLFVAAAISYIFVRRWNLANGPWSK